MNENEKKALDLINEAQKKLKSGFWGGIFGGGARYEDAIPLYERAGNSYKIAKMWQEAGDTFKKASELSHENKSNHEAASHLVEAANCYRKCNSKLALQALRNAISIYTDMGRFTIAAKHHMTMAEIYETESGDMEQAIKHYEQAADFYKGEESNSSANKCLLKVAHISAQMGHYPRAAELFEQIGRSSMENKLLIYGAKEHFFKAAVCLLCLDVTNGERAVKTYEELFPAFADSREYKLLQKVLAALNSDDVDAYSEALREYDNICRLEPLMTTLFLKIKKSMSGEVDLC